MKIVVLRHLNYIGATELVWHYGPVHQHWLGTAETNNGTLHVQELPHLSCSVPVQASDSSRLSLVS